MRIYLFILFCFILFYDAFSARYKNEFLNKGWEELIKDNDRQALTYFSRAVEEAKSKTDTETLALAYLNLGITSYSSSYSEGIRYALASENEFEKYNSVDPEKAKEGRGKVLQLLSAIKLRQGYYEESIRLSREVYQIFTGKSDPFGYRGLSSASLSLAYAKLNRLDSSEFFAYRSFKEHLSQYNTTYLPGAYCNIAQVNRRKNDFYSAGKMIDKALFIADSTGNRTAYVNALLELSGLQLQTGNLKEAESTLLKAKGISEGLTDRSYLLRTLESIAELKFIQKDEAAIIKLKDRISQIKDSLFQWEKEKLTTAMEVEFGLHEKENQLAIEKKEKEVVRLTNYLLISVLLFILIVGGFLIYYTRKNHRRDQLLLQIKEALIISIEEKRLLAEQTLQEQLDDRETQLTAMSLRIKEKSQLLNELKDQIESDKDILKNSPLARIINKDLQHEKDWDDFNLQFEIMNRNFYSRLKQIFPEASPNDLRLCALIRLNLSIKEMAAFLNISPDSVKTARYRLRKKLQLSTEDNLTEYIMNL